MCLQHRFLHDIRWVHFSAQTVVKLHFGQQMQVAAKTTRPVFVGFHFASHVTNLPCIDPEHVCRGRATKRFCHNRAVDPILRTLTARLYSSTRALELQQLLLGPWRYLRVFLGEIHQPPA